MSKIHQRGGGYLTAALLAFLFLASLCKNKPEEQHLNAGVKGKN